MQESLLLRGEIKAAEAFAHVGGDMPATRALVLVLA